MVLSLDGNFILCHICEQCFSHADFQFEINATRVRVGTEAAVPQLEKNMLAVVSLVLLEKTVKVCESGDETVESGDQICNVDG